MSSSASDPGKGTTPSLAGRIEALERETAAVTAALAQAQRVRLGITVLLAAFVGLTITVFYRQAKQLGTPAYQDQLWKAVQAKLEPRQDQLLKEAKILYDTAGQKATEVFVAQAKKDLPDYLRAAERERSQLVEQLQMRLEKKLADRFDKSLERYQKVLKQEFPLADNPLVHERMMNNVGLALQKLAKKYYADQLNVEMFALYDAWDEFPPSPAPGPDEDPLEDQLIGTLLDLLTVKLKNTEHVATP